MPEKRARLIHELSPRSPNAFVVANCGALPESLIENELFGHASEAYTGATRRRKGLIEKAQAGTLFLDDLDSLPLSAQVKLLQVLEERRFRVLGSPEIVKADIRIIAATNKDPHEAVRSGRLREDLYYRVAAVTLTLPPLRERDDDAVHLARYFLEQCAAKQGRAVPLLSPGAISNLLTYEWPGNVRELKNAIERAVVLGANRSVITAEDLVLGDPQRPFDGTFAEAKALFERGYIERLLRAHEGNVSRAADASGRSRRWFRDLMEKHGIDAADFKPESR